MHEGVPCEPSKSSEDPRSSFEAEILANSCAKRVSEGRLKAILDARNLQKLRLNDIINFVRLILASVIAYEGISIRITLH